VVDGGRRHAAADVETHRPPLHLDTVVVFVGFFVHDARVVQVPDDVQLDAAGRRVLQPAADARRGFGAITLVSFRGTALRVDNVEVLAANSQRDPQLQIHTHHVV